MKYILLALIVMLSGCAQLQYGAEREEWIDSPTGMYAIIRANCNTVQHMWRHIGSKDLQDPKFVATIEAFTRLDTMEIWYCTKAGLKGELHNIQSYKNLMDAAKQDRRNAFPLIRPPEMR